MKSLQVWIRKIGTLKLSALFAALISTSIWIFVRVRDINPAILQDEWIYNISSRKFSPWDQEVPFDFANYLFNFIYHGTVICGSENFYTCVKVLNIVFIQGFAISLLLVALRFLPFWGAFVFYASVMLSPTSIYASMFLPESLFFFLIGLTLIAVLHAAKIPIWRNWLIVGSLLGLAGLVKPHAFMAAMAVGIYLIISSLRQRPFWPLFGKNVAGLIIGFFSVRIVLGFLLAGPKALNVFSSYGATDSLGQFVGGVASGEAAVSSSSVLGAGAVAGAIGLFPLQSYTHLLVVGALVGASVAAIAIANIDAFKSSESTPTHNLAVLMAIWLGVLVISIVLFTGWITGNGDDHTTRVLLRYYDYLFPMIALAGLVVAYDKTLLANTKAWIRWALVAPMALVISLAYAGFFGTLTIQIADAPNLAGLVVDKTTLDVTANLMFLTLLVIAFFPKYTIWAMVVLIPWTLVSTGWQIQDQYRGFRAEPSAADRAGHFVADTVPRDQLSEVVILAESRFDGRVASFWMESDNTLEILGPGVFPAAQLPPETNWVLLIGNLQLDQGEIISSEDGYQLVRLKK